MHMAHRAVNAQIESMFSFNLEISNPAVMACGLLRLLSTLVLGQLRAPQLRKMFNSLVTRNLTWLDLLENLQVELS